MFELSSDCEARGKSWTADCPSDMLFFRGSHGLTTTPDPCQFWRRGVRRGTG